MKVLFIGNSYTYYNDLPKLFEKLAAENGEDVEAFSVTCGGRRLIENMQKTEDSYAEQLNALLSAHTFDLVILQEHSLGSLLDYDGFCSGITGLREKLGSRAKRLLLYCTWGRKTGSKTLEERSWTQESMTFSIADAYRKAGKALGIPVSYVGLKFYGISRMYPEIELYDADLTHPSYVGTCLAAITLYASVFHAFPQKCSTLELPQETLQAFAAQF